MVKPRSQLTALFVKNLAALMRADGALSSQNGLASASKVPQSTIGRLLRGEQSPTLDMVERLARAFDLEPWQMLVPELEPSNPPITKQIDDVQRQLFAKFKQAAEDLATYKIERKK